MSYFKDGAFRIDLNDVYDIKQIMIAIFAKLKNNPEKNLEQKDVIEWFHEQTNSGKSFLIVFDKFEQIKKPEVMKELNEFIVNLIDETTLMKIIILTTKKECVNVNNGGLWFKRIEWKPLSKEQLATIMEGLLKTNNKQEYTKDIKL